jgi:hypothetical protein
MGAMSFVNVGADELSAEAGTTARKPPNIAPSATARNALIALLL